MIERYYRSYVRALWHGFVAWVQRDALYRELAALDARGLKDIGITRADIPAIVEGRFWRGGGVNGEGYANATTPALRGTPP